ncbi:hypothetical protein AVEN_13575-1 [Araneus ventricosus]|uniref:Uncharacterized protein n=1 Tax=Araneus ventricosus TaxID=182803 RepID=A0A4Y2D6Z4_ARAVE|nr:hypothetical protein AVEN_13575-1 [Araneus ventricosus]
MLVAVKCFPANPCLLVAITYHQMKGNTDAFETSSGLRWPSGKIWALGVEGFQVRNPIPLKIRRVCDLFNFKSYIRLKRPPVGVVRKFGEEGSQIRCRPLRLPAAQNYKAPKLPSCCFKTGL